jgi:carboxymethylenebutenolidase
MGELRYLTADDTHRFTVYRATPICQPVGGVVFLHEIYGINTHVRSIADAFADEGYMVLIPALFDRVEKGMEIAFTEKGASVGTTARDEIGWDAPLKDIEACRRDLEAYGKIAVIGESYGGSLAWRAAAQLPFACAVAGSPGHLKEFFTERPQIPTQIHFAAHDPKTPEDLREATADQPNVETYTYDAGHAFTCPQRPGYAREATRLVEKRTLEFLETHVG